MTLIAIFSWYRRSSRGWHLGVALLVLISAVALSCDPVSAPPTQESAAGRPTAAAVADIPDQTDPVDAAPIATAESTSKSPSLETVDQPTAAAVADIPDPADTEDAAPPGTVAAGRSGSTARTLLAEIAVEPEHPGSDYDREDWPHWKDQDGDGCHARCEVLESERLPDGTWYSVFDGLVTSNPSEFDVDHLVPLAEAHESGGHRWDRATRQNYANDLSYQHSLIAVSASSNRSKGKKDPAAWLPPNADWHCFYAEAWVAVKSRWGLAADGAEHAALARILGGCPDRVISREYPIAFPVSSRTSLATVAPEAGATVGTGPGAAVQAGATPAGQLEIRYCDASAERVLLSGPPGFGLAGWRISDQGSNFVHTFAAGTSLDSDGNFLIASGDAAGDLKPWGSRSVWNNSGDVATLAGPGGEAISQTCS